MSGTSNAELVLVLRHNSSNDRPLTLLLSPDGERKLPSPLLCKGEGQGEGFSY